MPTLDFKQITDKLNAEFASDTRKIVFWYDDNEGFVNEIDSLEIVGAKLHKLTPTNQFYTKHLIERQDKESSYLLYAPFPKPDGSEYALEDVLLYSRRFYADKPSILMSDLRIDENLKPIMQKYIGFFDAKDRAQRFYGYRIENYTKEIIETALMSALCKTENVSFNDVLRVVLIKGDLEDNCFLKDFEKYDLITVFWQMCNDTFGYAESTPSLLRLAATLLVTYTLRQFQGKKPDAWECFISSKPGNVVAFLDVIMNHNEYRSFYDELAKHLETVLNIRQLYESTDIAKILACDAFQVFDEIIIKWIIERLHEEDTGAMSAGKNITSICEFRKTLHYGQHLKSSYDMLSSAYEIISKVNYTCPVIFKDIVNQYIESDYRIDSHYRHFYTAYDELVDIEGMEELSERVESVYTNKYLGRLLPAFSDALDVKVSMNNNKSQLQFFDENIKHEKNKTAVIISDALRYDVGRELFEKLNDDENCDPSISYMYGAIPAYTQLGLAAMLPHKLLEIKIDGKVILDGRQIDTTDKKDAVLKLAIPDSRCVSYRDMPKKSSKRERDELREIFTGMDTVYIYHNRIDNKGENTEEEVLAACSKAIDEIFDLVLYLNGNGNIYNFIITADHGFLYKREKFNESEKISLVGMKDIYPNRRFVIANKPLEADGVATARLADVINGEDERFISWPIGASVFKTSGGLNYVHGGASPQEMILPLIKVKTEKRRVDTEFAEIALVNTIRKVTNLIIHLDFIQKEPISDTVKAAEYKISFISEDGEKISNEHTIKADKDDAEPSNRISRLKFDFMNKEYDRNKQYFLTVIDAKTRVEKFRHPVTMDIAFANGIGFGF